MATPKPAAPSKPLTYTPPVFLKGETKSSELPRVEGERKRKPKFKKPTAKIKGNRIDIAIVDEKFNADGGVTLTLGEVVKELIGTPSNPKKVKKATNEKKPFVLDEHLTQRPFKDDRLMQLKASLQRNS